MELSTSLTVILLTVAALFTALFGYLGARPYNPKKGPRMVPWTFFMLLCFTAGLMLLVHLLTVLGFKTDPPQRY